MSTEIKSTNPANVSTCFCRACAKIPEPERLQGDGWDGDHHYDCKCVGCRDREEYETDMADEDSP